MNTKATSPFYPLKHAQYAENLLAGEKNGRKIGILFQNVPNAADQTNKLYCLFPSLLALFQN